MNAASESQPALIPRNADPRLFPAASPRSPLTTLILAGTLSATLFGSRVMLQTIQSAPNMIGFETFRRAATIWDTAMRSMRATAPDAALHRAVRKAEAG